MIYPTILCGGSGTRLWSLSRKSYPKQFVPLLGHKTLFQGANLRELPTAEAVEAIIAARRLDGPIRLIMVGGDWVRKGGPQAVAVAHTLQDRGIPVELHVVGAKLPEGLPDYVIGHGYVRKDDPKSWARFRALMEQAHFSILPTRADCCAVVLAEAAAFAVPALATRVGGDEAAVLEGETGYLFALDADPGDYCDKIEALITAPEAYAALCHSAYRAFHAELIWAKAGEQSAQPIRGLSTPQNLARP
ncbi:glycosyltransferase [Paenirhodobacter sp. CAU 1674]|uniref:glycosyltransferase n=1 Tax=Paenirhodobacter sp. CAU 1674 TaxID=3032596 RepID=UPI0023DA0BE3|nr:glycosyltransferase [Paenirhodobacter sp. CAU 1674]MDF2142050.1 glycosyltransferase [Paenirhodobacter sp. CAU 1674]